MHEMIGVQNNRHHKAVNENDERKDYVKLLPRHIFLIGLRRVLQDRTFNGISHADFCTK